MRIRLGKYFRGPGGTFASVTTDGKGIKKAGGGCLSVVLFMIIVSVALAFSVFAWIPAGIYLLALIVRKNDPDKKKKIVISSIVAAISFIFMIVLLIYGALTEPQAIHAEWEKAKYEVGESIEVPVSAEPERAILGKIELCENDIARMTWDDEESIATIYFQDPGTAELFFINDGEVQSAPILVTVEEPEPPSWEIDEEEPEPEEVATPEDPTDVLEAPEEADPQAPEEPAPEPTQEEPSSAEAKTPQSEMVWISANGSKYHSRSGCSNMKNPSEVTIDRAKELGKEPCKKCY